MKRRFNEETQKIDVIEKSNYQELVNSVYAAARSGITNIRVRVRDDEYLDLLGDVPTRESEEDMAVANYRESFAEALSNEMKVRGLRFTEGTLEGNLIDIFDNYISQYYEDFLDEDPQDLAKDYIQDTLDSGDEEGIFCELEESRKFDKKRVTERKIVPGPIPEVEDYAFVIGQAGLKYVVNDAKSRDKFKLVGIKITPEVDARLRIFDQGNYTLFDTHGGWEGLDPEEFKKDLADLLHQNGIWRKL